MTANIPVSMTKAEIEQMAGNICENMGDIEAFAFAAVLRNLADAVDFITKPAVIEAAADQGILHIGAVEVTPVKGATKWRFDGIEEYEIAAADVKAAQDVLKDVAANLKQMGEGVQETGEPTVRVKIAAGG